MNSDQANKWLTLFANFGVVIGLALLIYELRMSQNLAETEAAVRRLDQMQIAQVELATSNFITLVRQKALTEGASSLTPEERSRLAAWESSVRLRMRGQYIEYLNGYLSKEMADEIIAAAVRFIPLWTDLGYEYQNNEFERAVREAAGR